ncbi:1690_t:CDS:2 [Funneliformis geosporum]|uniref:1690_t:CDS:1 n=1 Tax=Funneliformis geosporum TaxID=1117311 RepID=A0A9W4SJU7_9GLOM|nr:1690_t:CDS:2 [Funneliformis geosporum]
MSSLLKEIKKRIKPKNIRSQYVNMEVIADVFAEEEEEEKAECENIKNALKKRLNLNELFNTTGMLKKSLEFIDDDEVRNKTKDLLKNKYDQFKANPLIIPAAPLTLLSNQSSLFSIFK